MPPEPQIDPATDCDPDLEVTEPKQTPASSSWTTTATREVYSNPWIRVREDEVVRPDGKTGIYGVVSMQNPSVFVVALTDNDEVLTVELYRYATNSTSLEVPAGGCDGQDPLTAAKRELLEETGYEAKRWQQIGQMNALNGVCNAPEYVFLAQGLYRPVQEGTSTVRAIDWREEQAAEGITAVRSVAWADLMTLVAGGRVSDGETVAALMFAALALNCLS